MLQQFAGWDDKIHFVETRGLFQIFIVLFILSFSGQIYSYPYIFCQKGGLPQIISVEDEDFVGTWFPGSPSLSHPDNNPDPFL